MIEKQLLEVSIGQTVQVISFNGGETLENKLRQLGLLPGYYVRMVRRAPFGGPVLLEIDGRSIAIGRGIAAKIQVKETKDGCDSH
ncbi:MAG: ferrous iron transport protein A [Anaerolineae bacterium]|nr:ferrous iron transport protein A [Anaerolineae bacterium]MBL6966125.1 ferrous iron transport protein A [Anaerolineales bacterium]